MSFLGNLFSSIFGNSAGVSVNSFIDRLTQNGMWDKIKDGSKTLGRETTRMALELYYVMCSPNTPKMDKVIIGVALGYQFTPGLLKKEDVGPILALVDNAITLAIAYKRVKKHVTPEITAQVNAQLAQWFDGGTTGQPAQEQQQTEAQPVLTSGGESKLENR